MRAANRSPSTVRLHRHYLNQLMVLTATPWTVNSRLLIEVMAREGWAAAETKKSARTVYRGFFRWAHGNGWIDDDPSLVLQPIKVPQGVPRPAPEFVVKYAVTRLDARLTFMAQLAAFGGLRVREIAVVHSRDVLDDVLVVHGKGGKQRLVPLEEPQLHGRLRQLQGYAFPNRYSGNPVSAGWVSKLLSDALPEGWTAHTLRHRLATRSYDGTGDLFAVMRLLGHSRPETTMRYVGLTDDRLRAAARAGRLAS
ncbi:tyrosine-type recombinase/integrase [Nocardioides soli]|uniref:Integrase n=1 Tax=Nocardioides soli TaxID=1036020 RepID=A0A7W4Z2I1_9ACTN|nr:tyrosine-type recombinase/integrase [Nocardioides soli]MBB3043937.1 integrase [Nocardioides soli]